MTVSGGRAKAGVEDNHVHATRVRVGNRDGGANDQLGRGGARDGGEGARACLGGSDGRYAGGGGHARFGKEGASDLDCGGGVSEAAPMTILMLRWQLAVG